MTDPLKHEWPYDTPEFPYKAVTDLPGLILAGEWDVELSAIRKATLKRLRDLKKLDAEGHGTEIEKLLARLKKQIAPEERRKR